MNVTCPKCGSENFHFVQESKEYFTIDAIHENGNIDLFALSDSYPSNINGLQCSDCGWEGSVKRYFETKNEEKSK